MHMRALHLLRLRLRRANRIPRAGDNLPRGTNILRTPRDLGRIISGEGLVRLRQALVVELGVFLALVWARDGRDGALDAGVVGDGSALCGHLGERAAGVGVLCWSHFGGWFVGVRLPCGC